jgi:uncharacterized protein (TIRG00374 family)
MTSPSRQLRPGLVVNALLGVLAFTLLGLVICQNRDKIGDVLGRRLDLRLLGLGLLIYQISLLIAYARWYLMVRAIEPRFELRATILLGSIGYVFGLVIPGSVGGDFIKAAYLTRMNIKRTQVISSMLIDRIVGLLGLFSLAAAAGVFAWGVSTPDVRSLIVTAWAALGLALLVLTTLFSKVSIHIFRRWGGTGHSRISLILHELEAMATAYRQRLGVVLASLGLSVLGHALSVLAFFVIGKMLFPNGITATLAQCYLMVPLTLFSTVVPLPFGALGLTEGIGDQLFKLVGHPSGALNMLGFRVLTYGCGLIAACVYLANLSEVRSLTEPARHLKNERGAGATDTEYPPIGLK